MLEHIVSALGGPHGVWWLAGAYAALAAGERIARAIGEHDDYDDGDALCSIGLALTNAVLSLALTIIAPVALYLLVYDSARIATIEPLGLAIPMAFVVHELAYYWDHRLAHRVGLLWAFHATHHSSNAFNHTTAARACFFDGKLQLLGALAAALLGVAPTVYAAVAIASTTWGIWRHASYVGDLGWAEHVLATPRNHEVHHARQPQYLDRNYSQVLIVWDKLFGSFEPYGEPPDVGLVHRVHVGNPLVAQFVGVRQLWRRMRSAERLRDRIAYLWRPPEWSHDGARAAARRRARVAAATAD